jgi:hypothetical protein
MVRELTQAQVLSCGNFSLIETFADKVAKKRSKFALKEITAYAERSDAIARAALVHPTYAEIISVFGGDAKAIEAKKQIDALKEKLAAAPGGRERERLEEKIEALRIWYDLILPEDFLSFVVGYALGVDKSDIKKVSEEMLVNAAALAQLGHDNPADHIGGAFTDFMREDINCRAWILLDEKRQRTKQHAR